MPGEYDFPRQCDGNAEVFGRLEGAKFDNGKLRMDLIPPEADRAMAQVLTMGAAKYGDRNWEKGLNWSRVLAALKRHLLDWEMRVDLDEESKLNHMKHVLWNAMALVTFIERGVGRDDRGYGKHGTSGTIL